MAAAFTWATSKNKVFTDAVRWAVAAGTASAMRPGLEFASIEQTKDVYKNVEVRTIS